MNWKEQPQLFANGKFQIMYQQVPYEITSWQPIIGRLELFHRPPRWIMEKHPADLKLIARPISDMRIGELHEFARLYWDFEGYEITYVKREGSVFFVGQKTHGRLDNVSFDLNDMRMPQCLYLLSIGVYPFNQDDFKKGLVIEA